MSNEERESSRLETDSPDLKMLVEEAEDAEVKAEEVELLMLFAEWNPMLDDVREEGRSSITCILRSPPPSKAALETTRFTALYDVSK